MLKFTLKTYLFLAYILGSCQQYHPMEMGTRFSSNRPSSAKYEPLTPPIPKFFVVLLPSLGASISTTDKIKEKLKEAFGKDVMVIQIKSLEKLKTSTDKIRLQEVDEVYNELIRTLAHKFCLKSSAQSGQVDQYFRVPMHIFGHNAPSLVPYLVKEKSEASQLFWFHFNINSISLASAADPQRRDELITYFQGDADKSIPAYIDFLNQQQKQQEENSCTNQRTRFLL